MLHWTDEQKALTNIKKIIARVWRMNHEQLYTYTKKLRKNSCQLLPGRIGGAFLQLLEQIAQDAPGTSSGMWPQLMRDADYLLNLIRQHEKQEEKVWLAALQRLEAQRRKTFHTVLGLAFIMSLKDKLEPQTAKNQKSSLEQEPQMQIDAMRQLEGVADWLMDDRQQSVWSKRQERRREKSSRYNGVHRVARHFAVPVFACLSVCFMSIWLYGQAKTTYRKWQLQQMKISAMQQPDVFMAENPKTKADTLSKERKRSAAEGKEQQADSVQKYSGGSNGVQKEAGELNGVQKEAGALNVSQKDGCQKESSPQKLPQYKEMAAEYTELFGWLKIPDTQIDLPVMQPQGEKDFYLHHDFTGASSVEGALFVDAKSSWPQDNNLVIYGHNMKNGHMFGTLDLYKNADYFQEHREIRFDTVYEAGVYEAVAVLKTRIRNENEQGFRYYQFFQYHDEETFQECLDFVKENQMFDTGDALQYGDQILMLSTCEYSQENGRLVVVARRQR